LPAALELKFGLITGQGSVPHTQRGDSVKEFAYCFYLADSPAGLIVTGEEISG